MYLRRTAVLLGDKREDFGIRTFIVNALYFNYFVNNVLICFYDSGIYDFYLSDEFDYINRILL